MTLLIVTSVSFLLQHLLGALSDGEEQTRSLAASQHKAVEQARELGTQAERLSATEQMLRDLVQTLETPIVRLSQHILLAPLIGTIDTQRAKAITQRLLGAAASNRSQLIIIDISGVSSADDATITALVQAAQALRLVGCRVTLTGVAPSVALSLAHFNAELSMVDIARSPEHVLEREVLYTQSPA